MHLIIEAEKMVRNQLTLVEYENEYVAAITLNSELIYLKHYHGGMFMGWNLFLYDSGSFILLETCETANLAYNLLKSIKKALAFGAAWFKLPDN